MKNSAALLILVFLLHPLVAQEKDKNYSEALDLVAVWLEAQKDFEDLPGITASVVQDQETLWKGSFGKANLEKNIPASTGTLFSICSISKLFTSVAIMKLYDEGKIRLDDKISDILPWYNLEQKFPESGPITVRNILSHSSGLPREANFPYWTAPDFLFPEKQNIQDGLKDQETLYPSATYFQYSNLGLTLLGEVVEEVSGMPYDDYVQTHILEPLRLQQTRTLLPKELYGEELAIGYGALKRNGDRDRISFFDAKGIKAAAGFSSNIEDLSNFAKWQFRLLETAQPEILQPATLKNMHNVHWTDPDFSTTWGLGFAVWKGPDGKKWVSHGGSCPGYRTVLQLQPSKKRAYVVMINAGGTNPGKYGSGINGLLSKYESEAASKDSLAVNLNEYSGFFNPQPWNSEVYVAPWKGKLALLDLPSNNPAEGLTLYEHVNGDVFQRIRDDGEAGELLNFTRDENGDISRFESHGNYSVKIDRP